VQLGVQRIRGDERAISFTAPSPGTKAEPASFNLGKTEAILPRGEQIRARCITPNERIKAVVLEVKKQGHRVKIVLSRTHPDFVRRLFEGEIPEIKETHHRDQGDRP